MRSLVALLVLVGCDGTTIHLDGVRDSEAVETGTLNDTQTEDSGDTADSGVVDTADTAGKDTGDTASTDTADTATEDSGVVDTADTSDTAIVDTAIVDTADSSDTGVVDTGETATDPDPNDVDDDGDGWTENTGDCDDENLSKYPGAAETCNGLDEDCDGVADNGLAPLTTYADADSDGYGNASTTNTSCAIPAGYVADNTDCDDSDDTINPGMVEMAQNGKDDDCDALTTYEIGGAYSLEVADYKITGEDAGDYSGASLSMGDVNADGYDDLLIGQNTSNTGGAHLVYGPLTGDLDLGDAGVVEYTGATSRDRAGSAVTLAGDLNDDGRNDVVIGAWANSGSVYVDYSPGGGATTSMNLVLTSTGTQCGKKLAAGEVSGDGIDDLAVGCAGYVYILNGASVTGLTASDIQSGTSVIGENASYGLTPTLGGDVDGDGINDLLVGDQNDDSATGAVYLVYGPISSTTRLSGADSKVAGEAANDSAGAAVATGDLNDDGYDDVVIGATDENAYKGAAYIMYGPVASGNSDLSTADAKIEGDTCADCGAFGWAVAVGDLNNDGDADLAIGSSAANADTYFFYGAITGTMSALSADASFSNGGTNDYGGYALAMGDTNKDGYSDLLVGAYKEDSGGTEAGAAYLWLGTGL